MFYRTSQSATKEAERKGDLSGIRSEPGARDGMRRHRKTKLWRGHAPRSARLAGAADRRGRWQSERLADAVLRPCPNPCQSADEKTGRRARPARGNADSDKGPHQC